jgi:MFS family permease
MAVPVVTELWQAVTLLLVRSLLSQMDKPARTSYVMAVVTPPERPAAASLTAVPRSLAAAVSPTIAGWLLTVSPFGWSLLRAGALKATYDLALLAQFRHHKPPEERSR